MLSGSTGKRAGCELLKPYKLAATVLVLRIH